MAKAPDAFRTISEVAELLDTPAHVLRFWESKFTQVKPVKRAGGRRYYRPDDVALLGGIKGLLHDQGMTIKGAQKVLRERGVKSVMALGRADGDTSDDGDVIDTVANDTAQLDAVSTDTSRAGQDAASAKVAEDGPITPDRVGVTITSVTFVDAAPEPADMPTSPEGLGDNVVPLTPAATALPPQDATTPEPDTAQDADAAPQDVVTPDLPALPAPRPITGSRVLGALARMDRPTIVTRAGAIRPLADRLEQAHRRLTQR